MKSLILISTLASSLLLTNEALADHKRHHRHHHGHQERYVVVDECRTYAPVLRARPIYERVAIEVPRHYCRVETVAHHETHRHRDSFEGTVVGGLIGAAIGHEIGHGSGHATAVGGLIGASIGNDVGGGTRRVTRYQDREVCSQDYAVEYEERLVGYDVTYRHNGRVYHTQTDQHPGDRIRLDRIGRGY